MGSIVGSGTAANSCRAGWKAVGATIARHLEWLVEGGEAVAARLTPASKEPRANDFSVTWMD